MGSPLEFSILLDGWTLNLRPSNAVVLSSASTDALPWLPSLEPLSTTTTSSSMDTSPLPVTLSSLTSQLEWPELPPSLLLDLPRSSFSLLLSSSPGCLPPNTTETTESDGSDVISKTLKKRPESSMSNSTTDVPL